MTSFPPLVRAAFCAALLASLTACAPLGKVEAWQKGELTKPGMAFESDRLEAQFDEHTYSSKEAAAGGAGVGGGGCGCN